MLGCKGLKKQCYTCISSVFIPNIPIDQCLRNCAPKNLNTSHISSSFQIGWWKILNILSSFSGWCQCWHDKNEWNSWGECRRFWCHSTSRCYKESAKQLCEGHRAVVSCWYVTLSQQLFSILKCFYRGGGEYWRIFTQPLRGEVNINHFYRHWVE